VCRHVGAPIPAIFTAWWSFGLDDLNGGVVEPNSGGGGRRLTPVNSGFTRKANI